MQKNAEGQPGCWQVCLMLEAGGRKAAVKQSDQLGTNPRCGLSRLIFHVPDLACGKKIAGHLNLILHRANWTTRFPRKR